MTQVLKHGSLFKHEIVSLMKKYSKNDVEKAIQNLTLQQFLKGATDLKAQMDAAVKTIDGDVIDEDQKLNKR